MHLFIFTIIVFALWENGETSRDVGFVRAQCKARCLQLFAIQPKEKEGFLMPQTWDTEGFPPGDYILCHQNPNRKCTNKCFEGCNSKLETTRPELLRTDDCQIVCQPQRSSVCFLGCRLLVFALTNRAGTCPPHTTSPSTPGSTVGAPLSGSMQVDCKRSCHVDSDCYNPLYRCCQTGCSTRCLQAAYNSSVPPLAPKLDTRLREGAGGLELGWKSSYRQFIKDHGPVMFILQIRFCSCKRFNENYLEGWKTLLTSYKFGAKLDSFEKGHIYQFRLAAVFSAGTRGFGPPSDPFQPVQAAPQAPSRPRNLTDSLWRIYADGQISVLITWMPPEHSDLRIFQYEVMWVVDHGYVQSDGRSLEALTSYKQSVPPEPQRFLIENLKPDTSYKVQVRAVSVWSEHGRLESENNTLFISTFSIKPSLQNREKQNSDIESDYEDINCKCNDSKRASPELNILDPVYFKDELSVEIQLASGTGTPYLVEWSPRVCIDSDETNGAGRVREMHKATLQTTLRMTRLNFNCRYSLKLTPLGEGAGGQRRTSGSLTSNRRKPIRSCFCTPACTDVPVAAGIAPQKCFVDKFSLPPPPKQLAAKLLDKSSLSYLISWKPPQPLARGRREGPKEGAESAHMMPSYYTPAAGAGGHQFSRYRVVWAPREEEPVNKELYNDAAGFSPILDFRNSDVRVISKNVTSLMLRNLKRATFYIVRVQTLSFIDGTESESPPAVHYFTTVGFKNPVDRESSAEVSRFIKRPNNSSFQRSYSLCSTVLYFQSLLLTILSTQHL